MGLIKMIKKIVLAVKQKKLKQKQEECVQGKFQELSQRIAPYDKDLAGIAEIKVNKEKKIMDFVSRGVDVIVYGDDELQGKKYAEKFCIGKEAIKFVEQQINGLMRGGFQEKDYGFFEMPSRMGFFENEKTHKRVRMFKAQGGTPGLGLTEVWIYV